VARLVPVLGDVADITAGDQALLTLLVRLPLSSMSGTRLWTRAEILELIRAAVPPGLVIEMTGAECTRVSLRTVKPAAGEVARVLLAHLTSVTPWREDELQVRSIANLDSIELPEGEVQLRVVSHAIPANYRNALIPVEVVFEGRALRTYWVKADVRVHAKVAQLARPVAFGRRLLAEDLRPAECDIEDPRAAYVRDCAEAVGMTARRALSTGELLRQDMLNEATLVQSGETVRLTLENGPIRITAPAHALQNGRMGDRIKVRNMDSNRAITAVVTGRGEARVVR
jgi:flagella basal body P-ring formation protein FlgA